MRDAPGDVASARSAFRSGTASLTRCAPRRCSCSHPQVVGVLKRSDFDMKFNQALGSGNMLVGNKVNVSLDISTVNQE